MALLAHRKNGHFLVMLHSIDASVAEMADRLFGDVV